VNEDNENKELVFDVDMASSLKTAFCAAGWNTKHVKTLARTKHLSGLRSVIEGYAEIRPRAFEINLEMPPVFPKHQGAKFELKEHNGAGIVTLTREGSRLFLDGKKINLFVWKGQRKGCLTGEIEKAVKGMKVLNASVAAFLGRHQFLIPPEWNRFHRILFWGTKYTQENYGEYVASLELPRFVPAHAWIMPIEYESGAYMLPDCPSAILEL
jgi:hypothetical protein